MAAAGGAILAASIPIAAAALGAGINAGATASMNKKTRIHAYDMWKHEQAAALENWNRQNEYNYQMWGEQKAYNESLWHMQNRYAEERWNIENQYNSPAMQMARFKEAGLNPHLIYGQSNMGGSVSTGNMDSAPAPRGGNIDNPRYGGWNPKAPQFDLHQGLMAYAQFRESAARTDNLEVQNRVLEQDAILRAAQTAETVTRNAKGQFELGLASQLRQTSVDAAEAGLRKIRVETDLALNRDEREAAMNSSNLAEAAARIQNMRGVEKNLELDSQLKAMDIELKKLGVQPTDNLFFRILGRALGRYLDGQNPYDRIMNYTVPDTRTIIKNKND